MPFETQMPILTDKKMRIKVVWKLKIDFKKQTHIIIMCSLFTQEVAEIREKNNMRAMCYHKN